MLGRLAGSYKIEGELVCNEVKKSIGDSGSSGFYSIDDAAKTVGKSMYQAILECVLPKTDTKSN
ncbi:MAG: hypothetical protein HOP21_03535 [Methylotenera sp.]|nr:hypothetical protein [Methylotenera sp.]